ncbi:MAG: ABC-F family ATP-binding cassette domain-containing protein [Chloroflexia bacterium]
MTTILTARNLSKAYGAVELFHGLTLYLQAGRRVALVGVNGAGKSTLLRLLAGCEEPDEGEIIRARGLRTAYLTQEVDLELRGPLLEVARSAFPDLQEMERRLHELETAMAAASPEAWNGVARRYAELQTRYEAAGGYDYERRIRETLSGLGFSAEDLERPAESLSGGERTRLALALTLLRDPDLLLLDEPTNHLDIAAIEWLEGFLERFRGTLVVISHDRRFLDHIATDTWDLDFGSLEMYPGNYSRFVELKAARRARQEAEYQAQQERIAKEEAFIHRYRAGQRAREARGREKKLSRLERLERPREHRTLRLTLQAGLRSGEVVLAAEGLQIGFPGRPLFACPELEVRRQERVALIGPNGCGKTTFLRTILGQVPPQAGRLQLGHGVSLGYLPQTHEDLNPEQTVLEAVQEICPMSEGRARNFLGRFLFSGDDVYKRLGDLSGGERSRVALARLTLTQANFLLLDEPTNHLDIPAREALEEVLSGYEGTILLVSHDRALIDALATQVWAVSEGRLVVFPGKYSEYLAWRESRPAGAAAGASRPERVWETGKPAARPVQERRRREELARLQALEEEISRLEEEKVALVQEMERAGKERALGMLLERARRYEELQEELGRLYQKWAELAETLGQ